MTRKEEMLLAYEEAKKAGKVETVMLWIHMPGGETEVILNPEAESKMEYICRTYSDDLVHQNSEDIFIEDYHFSIGEPTRDMTFAEAYLAMKEGHKVKLPSWGGYWCWDSEKETIVMHCRPKDADEGQGDVLDIRETQRVDYTIQNMLSDEWMIADEGNCPVLGGTATFDFGTAIRYLKRGQKVKRLGWNGKNQHIELAKNIGYIAPSGETVNCDHEAIGNMAVAFCGTSGVQMGWLASQADMLAEDWCFAED